MPMCVCTGWGTELTIVLFLSWRISGWSWPWMAPVGPAQECPCPDAPSSMAHPAFSVTWQKNIFKKSPISTFVRQSIQTCIHIPDKLATGIWRPRHDPCSHYTSLQYLYHMTITWPDKFHIHPLVHVFLQCTHIPSTVKMSASSDGNISLIPCTCSR